MTCVITKREDYYKVRQSFQGVSSINDSLACGGAIEKIGEYKIISYVCIPIPFPGQKKKGRLFFGRKSRVAFLTGAALFYSHRKELNV